jgi:hypothetical protein
MSRAVMTAGFRRLYIRQSSTQVPNKFDAVRSHLEKNFNFISAVSVISFGATSSVYFCGKIYEEYKNSVMTMDIMKEKLRSMEALSALEIQSVKKELTNESALRLKDKEIYDGEIQSVKEKLMEKLTNESALRLKDKEISDVKLSKRGYLW